MTSYEVGACIQPLVHHQCDTVIPVSAISCGCTILLRHCFFICSISFMCIQGTPDPLFALATLVLSWIICSSITYLLNSGYVLLCYSNSSFYCVKTIFEMLKRPVNCGHDILQIDCRRSNSLPIG